MTLTETQQKPTGGRLLRSVNSFVERMIPSPLVFALVLTMIAMVMALTMTPSGPVDVITSWGDGFAGLLVFMAQMALMLLFGGMVANTRIVKRGLVALASFPRGRVFPYVFIAFVTLALTMLNWAVALVAAALISKEIAAVSKRRGEPVHFPLLIAAAYMVMLTSQMAPFGAIPLTAATEGSFVEETLGRTVPLAESSLSPLNLIAIVLTFAVVCATIGLMAPKRDQPVDAIGDFSTETSEDDFRPSTFGERLDGARLITLLPGLALLVYAVVYFIDGGSVELDIVNWILLGVALCFAANPQEITNLAKRSVSNVSDILLQFPIYAGIMGIIGGTGLGAVITDWFVQVSTFETFPFFAFLSAAMVNFFIPSGGGQFAVQGPIMLDAGTALGVDPGVTIMAFSYGDQLTNMIQPFWALPLLAMAGLRLRAILGYTILIMLVTGIAWSILLLGTGFTM
ncbi:TIGR00366 family protein [Leucobacter sp. GX24907]